MAKCKIKFFLLILIPLLGALSIGSSPAKAESLDTATLRILSTNDLHGQVTSYGYETHLDLPKNGLSKIATLVEQNREEVGSENTLLVDDGDFFYDFSTNYFYENYPHYDQPILKAMEIMNYDYITLGNHEFDYPWDYLKHQLEHSGLADRVLVSNTIWHDNGELVFAPSAVTTKMLTTSGGSTLAVKIGIIGSTTNSISTRRGDYVNEIDAVNNYDSIVAEAKRLKNEEKVTIVVVLLHGGIGSEKTDTSSDNIGYALSKVSSIDAIVTGHTHEAFPAAGNSDITSSSIDESTGCINGKPVVATSSHARALGIIDLNLVINVDGSVSIASGKSSLDYVTAETAENKKIKAMFLQYKTLLEDGADQSTYSLANGISYHNYDTVLQDSNLFQLYNNAKISYGQAYIAQYLPDYKNVPVIAGTRNLTEQSDPFVLIKDTLSASKISLVLSESSASRPSGYVQLYEISGKNLREWLEYNVSMYATEGTTFKNLLKNYVSMNPKVSTLLQESYVYNWNSEYVFDGISYAVDLTQKARYIPDGTMTNPKNKRIKSLTFNGVEVTNAQKFVIVTDSGLPSLSFLPEEMVDTIKEVKDNATGKGITLDYIKRLSAFGNISVTADHNWSLTAGKNYTFLLGISKKLAKTVSTFSWTKGLAAETTAYSFYKGTLPAVTQNINLIVSQGRTEINNDPVPVVISATSKNAIKEIKYLKGNIKKTTDQRWEKATKVIGNSFTSKEDGVYTILATDSKGNRALSYITVDRYASDVLVSPVLNRLTNRNTTFTGTATPYATIHAMIDGRSYTGTAKSDGTFSIIIASPKAFSQISVYTEYTGKKSANVTAAVRKTGPDAVQMNKILINHDYVTGTADPETIIHALIWTTIYVGMGETDKYKASEFYNSKYKIVETDITLDKSTGEYRIKIPYAKINMKVFVFAVDRFGATSKSTMLVPTYY